MKNKTCVYCENPEKITVVWKETEEYVCYDCRLDKLDEEFGFDREIVNPHYC